MTPATIAHEVLCAALFYTVFCRLVRADSTMRCGIRFAFLLQGSVACLGLVGPLSFGLQPTWFSLAMLASIVGLQVMTAHHWRHGVPAAFKRECEVRK